MPLEDTTTSHPGRGPSDPRQRRRVPLTGEEHRVPRSRQDLGEARKDPQAHRREPGHAHTSLTSGLRTPAVSCLLLLPRANQHQDPASGPTASSGPAHLEQVSRGPGNRRHFFPPRPSPSSHGSSSFQPSLRFLSSQHLPTITALHIAGFLITGFLFYLRFTVKLNGTYRDFCTLVRGSLSIHIFITKENTLQASLVAQTLKNPPANAGDTGSIPRSQRSPGEGNGSPLQHSCLEHPMDRGA